MTVGGYNRRMSSQSDPLFCDRCSIQLEPGRGNFYVIKIEAVADPSPPIFDAPDAEKDATKEIQRLVEESSEYSAQELMDQVYRRLTIFLCLSCYSRWIENPSGDA